MIQTILLFIVSLFVVIVAHELGHFIASKRVGVAVEEFGIGFPPRIVGRMWRGTLYSINAIPIGAFVKSKGENDRTVEGSLAGRGPWHRLLVYVAGPLANILLAFILLSVFFALPRAVVVSDGVLVYQVQENTPAYESGLQSGDIIVSADGRAIRTWQNLQTALAVEAPGDSVEIGVLRNDTQRHMTVTPEFAPELGRNIIGITLGRNIVSRVEPRSPAAQAGVSEGDSLLGVNGVGVINQADLAAKLTSAADDETLTLNMLREEESYTVELAGPVAREADIGLELRWAPDTRIERMRSPIGTAVLTSATYIVSMPALIVASIPLMQEDPSLAFVGPIGAGQLTVEAVQTFGLANLVFIGGLISIGIALFNLIPIPPLDGGGILVALAEAVRRGKPLSERAVRFAYAAGTALLITLIILITMSDLLRLIEGRGFGL